MSEKDKRDRKFIPPKSIFKKKSKTPDDTSSCESGVEDVKKTNVNLLQKDQSPESFLNNSVKVFPSLEQIPQKRVPGFSRPPTKKNNCRESGIYDADDDDWDESPPTTKNDTETTSDGINSPKTEDLARILKKLPPKGIVKPDWGKTQDSFVPKSKHQLEKINLLPSGSTYPQQWKRKISKSPDVDSSKEEKMKPRSRKPKRHDDDGHFSSSHVHLENSNSVDFKLTNVKEPIVKISLKQNTEEIQWGDVGTSKRFSDNYFGEEFIPCKQDMAKIRAANENAHIDELLILLKTEILSAGNKLENVDLPEALKDRFLKIEVPDSYSAKPIKDLSIEVKSVVTPDKCNCEKCDGWTSCFTWRAANLCNDGEKQDGNTPLLSNYQKPLEIVRTLIGDVLVHGQLIPDTESNFRDLIDEDVMSALTENHCSDPNPVQKIVWPAILRGMSVCVVDRPRSGKSLSYLPALCTLLRDRNSAPKRPSRSVTALILCNTLEKAQSVSQKAALLFSNMWDDCPEVTLLKKTTQLENRDFDLVVTTPDIFEDHSRKGTLNLKALSYIVLEVGEQTLKNFPETMKKLLLYLNELCLTRPRKLSLEIMITCEHWSADVQNLIKKLHVTPLICFRDYIEAAVYSGVQFHKKKVQSNYKKFYLEDLLKKHYSTTKTIVFCENDDVKPVSELLTMKGIENFQIFDKISVEDYQSTIHAFNSTSSGHHKVLLCTDKRLEKDTVANADWLVHFYIPPKWIDLVYRHRFMINNFNSPLVEPKVVRNYDSFLIVDEKVDEKGEIMVNFFNTLMQMVVSKFQI